MGDDAESDLAAIDRFLEASTPAHIGNWIHSRIRLVKASVKHAAVSVNLGVRRLTEFFRSQPEGQSREQRHVQRLHEPPDAST